MISHLSEILPIIQALPSVEKEQLFEMLAVELNKTPAKAEKNNEAEEPFKYDPGNPSLGLFYDEPEAIDEVVRLAMEAREARNWRNIHE